MNATPMECAYGPGLLVRRFDGPYVQQTTVAAREEFLRLILDRVPRLIADLRPQRCFNLTPRRRVRSCRLEARYGFDELHKHPHAEIVLVVSGSFVLIFGDKAFVLQQGDVVLLPPNQIHCDGFVNSSTPYELLWHGLREGNYTVHLSRYSVNGRRNGYQSLGHVLFPSAAVTSMTESLCRQPLKLDRIKEILLHFNYRAVATMQQDDSPTLAKHPLVIESLRIMRGEFAAPLSVSRIAERLKVTPNYFSALFVREVGTSFTQQLQRIRLNHVPALLQDPTLQIKEIGRACGFQSSYHFTRLFKDAHGVTPTEYRRSLQTHFV